MSLVTYRPFNPLFCFFYISYCFVVYSTCCVAVVDEFKVSERRNRYGNNVIVI